jgi:hypothetical protein
MELARAALIERDLRAYTTEWLCGTYSIDLHDALTAIIDAIDEPWKEPRHVARRALQLFGQKRDPLWSAIAARRSAERATNVVVYQQTLYAIAEELVCRAPPGGVTTLRAFLSNTALYQELLGAMKLENLTDYRYPDDSLDLQQEGLQGAFKRYLKEKDAVAAALPSVAAWPPPPTTSLLAVQLPGERWAFWRNLRQQLVRDFPIRVLPLIGPQFPQLPEAARQGWRREVEQRDAKMRGGTGGRHAKLQGTEQEPVVREEFNEATGSSFKPESSFATSTGAIQHRTTEDRATERETYEQLMEAGKHLGGFERFCAARSEGKNIEEAAEAADISPRTAQNYLEFIRSFVRKSE